MKDIYNLNVNDNFYIIDADGEIYYGVVTEHVTQLEDDSNFDDLYSIAWYDLKSYIAMGNIYLTREDAEKVVIFRESLDKIQRRLNVLGYSNATLVNIINGYGVTVDKGIYVTNKANKQIKRCFEFVLDEMPKDVENVLGVEK